MGFAANSNSESISSTSNNTNQHIDSFLLQLTTDLIFCFNKENRFSKANAPFCRLLQLPKDLILNKTLAELGFPTNIAEQWVTIISRITNGEKIDPAFQEFQLNNGKLFSYNLNFHAIPSADRTFVGVAVIANNILHQQEELIAERTLLRTIIDSVPESVYVKDAAGGKVIANTQDLIYMGLDTEKDAIGKTDYDVYATYNSAYFNKDDELVLQEGSSVINKLDYFIDANNNQHWLLTSKVPIKNKDNEIIGLIGVGRDVTERQKILDELFQTQERLKKITLSTADWIWEIGSDGFFTYCSESVEVITGWKPDEIAGNCFLEFLFPKEGKSHPLMETIMKAGSLINLEYWINHKDGSEVCILINGYPNTDTDGNIKGYTGVIKDITDWKLKERSIKELNDRFITLIEALPDGVFLKDGNGRWLITNHRAKSIFNLGESEWIGKTDKELALLQPNYTDFYNSCINTDNEAWEARKITYSYEEGYDKYGNYNKFHVSKIPLFEQDGSRKGLVILGRDITKELKEEQQLKLLETGIEHSSDSITIVEINHEDVLNSKIVYVNEACTAMYGYSKEEFINQPTKILTNPNYTEEDIRFLIGSIHNGIPIKMEVLDYKKNGEEIWTVFSLTPVANKEGVYTHWISIKKDVSEYIKHEQNIKKAIIQGQENEKYFISGELHDNVAQILVGSKLTLSRIKGSTEKEIEYLKLTKEYIDKAIDEIRSLSHSLSPSAYFQKNLISSIDRLLKSINKENQYTIDFEFDSMEHVEINGELQLNIYRILQEQLQNIIKHAVATQINVGLKLEDNKTLLLSIVDNGIGFDTNTVSKGIGLQNIKNRAETFYGKYTIISAPDKGCELQISIPLK